MSLPTATGMSQADAPMQGADNELFEYRSIHVFAVLGVVLGILSSVVFFTAGVDFNTTLVLAPIPVAAIAVSLYALSQIAAAPDLYTGRQMAVAGLLLAALFLFGGVGYAGYVHATEVPEGYRRTSFVAMKPTDQDLVNRDFITPEIMGYLTEQEPIFLKGYIRPDSIKFKQNLSEFLLVRDNNQCCFGDLSKVKYFDQVKVQLAPGLTTDFNRGLFRLGGTLKIGPGEPTAGTPITFVMQADYVKP